MSTTTAKECPQDMISFGISQNLSMPLKDFLTQDIASLIPSAKI